MGSSHPFSSVELYIEDSLRVICVVGYILLIAKAIVLAVNTKRRIFAPATVWGLTAIIILGTSATGTEIQRIGHSMFEGGYWWRLPMNLIGLLVSLITLIKVQKYPIKPPREKPWG